MSSEPHQLEVIPEPAACARLVASIRGDRVAAIEPGRVVLVELPGLVASGEITLPGTLDDTDVVFASELGRLVVLTRDQGQSFLYVVDPAGPAKLGELVFTGDARIAGVAGDHVAVATSTSTVVVDVTRGELDPLPLRLRKTPSAVGRLGEDRLVIALAGVLEEWSLAQRAPTRRLHVDGPVEPRFLGGTAHRVWMIPRGAPDRLDVVNFANRATRRIDLPEPVACARPHPTRNLVAVIGEHTRTAFVVHLARRDPLAAIDVGPLRDLAWAGRSLAFVAKPEDRPLALVTIADDAPARPARRPALVRPAAPPAPAPADAPEGGEGREDRDDRDDRELDAADPPATQWSRDEINARLAAWRQRFQPGEKEAGRPLERAEPEAEADHPGGWRAVVAAWARTIRLGAQRPPPAARGLLDVLRERIDLEDELVDAITLLYGAYLNGFEATAVAELAGVVGWRWEEALGNGALAASGLAAWKRGTVTLVPEVTAMLDERPPRTGELVAPEQPAPGTRASVAVVARGDAPLHAIATWLAPTLGAVLVPDDRAAAYPRQFLLEARVRDVAPLVPWSVLGAQIGAPPHPSVLIVADPAIAAELSVPVHATWPPEP